MVRLVVLLATLIVTALPGLAQARFLAQEAARQPVVVIGVDGLTWQQTRALDGGTADLVARTVRERTCPRDAWLTIGAGARAAGGPSTCTDVVLRAGSIEGWSDDVAATAAARSGARLGSLAARVGCVASVGPAAAAGAATSDGRVQHAAASVPEGLAACPVVLVDARADDVPRLTAQAGSAVVLLVGTSSAQDVVPLVIRGGGFDGRVVQSPSTRQDGLVLLTDLTPTIAALAGVAPDPAWTGEQLHPGDARPAAERIAAHEDLDRMARLGHDAVPVVFGAWAVAVLVLVAATWAGRRRAGARTAMTVGMLWAGSIPVATFLARLVPWWRWSAPMAGAVAVTFGWAAVVAAAAWAARRRPLGPLAVVCAVTALVIAADVATGSHLALSSAMGEHPAVGGRFYGLGNVSSALLATSTLLLSAAVARPGDRRRTMALLVAGLAVVAFVARPGADFGGVAALFPAVVYLALRLLGLRVDARRGVLLALATGVLLATACLLDYLRPADARSHLGRFVGSVVDGSAGDVVGRKLAQNWAILTSSPATLLVPLLAMLLLVLVVRPPQVVADVFAQAPTLRPGLVAVLVMIVLAMALNDSGATLPAPVLVLVGPLLLATTLLRRAHADQR